MIKAIIYTSNTGFTKKYAQMLALETGLQAFELGKAPGKIKRDDPIIYMDWLKAGRLMGMGQAAKQHRIAAVCAVGMGAQRQGGAQAQGVQRMYHLDTVPVFYLQGGYDGAKLKGMNRFMMGCMTKMMAPKLEKKKDRSAEEEEMLALLRHGGDKVNKKNLVSVLSWYGRQNTEERP